MKTIGQALPAGVLPDSTARSQGPVPPPEASAPAPGGCAFCRDRHPRYPAKAGGWEHFRTTLEGVTLLGPCSSPPPDIARTEKRPPPRTADECRARLAEIAKKARTASTLVTARETFSSQSHPEDE